MFVHAFAVTFGTYFLLYFVPQMKQEHPDPLGYLSPAMKGLLDLLFMNLYARLLLSFVAGFLYTMW